MQTSNHQPSESDAQQQGETQKEEKAGEQALYEFSTNAEKPVHGAETNLREEPARPASAPVYEVQPGIAYPPPPSFYQNMPDPLKSPSPAPVRVPAPAAAPFVTGYAPFPPMANAPYQPTYQAYPGMPQTYPMAPTKRRSRKTFWIVFSVIAAILLIGCALFSWGAYSFTAHVLSPLVQGETASLQVVTNYYEALEQQDYSTAYTYIQSATMTETVFTQQATQRDNQSGVVTSFQIGTPSLIGTMDNSAYSVPTTVTRNANASYTSHLDLHKIGSDWKITYLDLI